MVMQAWANVEDNEIVGEGKDLVERQRFFNYTDECHHYTGHQWLVVPWFDEYGAGDDYCV